MSGRGRGSGTTDVRSSKCVRAAVRMYLKFLLICAESVATRASTALAPAEIRLFSDRVGLLEFEYRFDRLLFYFSCRKKFFVFYFSQIDSQIMYGTEQKRCELSRFSRAEN